MEAIVGSTAAGQAPPHTTADTADDGNVPLPEELAGNAPPVDGRAGVVDLYRSHHRSLVRFAALVAPDPGLAEDLVQEAFVRLYSAWDRLASPDRAIAYVRVTVVNLARGRARRAAVANRFRSDRDADAASAEEVAMGRERREAVLVALRRLPVRQRECLVLRHYLGMTESQIATELRISIGSVRKHTQRGMAALDKRLEGCVED